MHLDVAAHQGATGCIKKGTIADEDLERIIERSGCALAVVSHLDAVEKSKAENVFYSL